MRSLLGFAIACLSLLLVMWGWRMKLKNDVAKPKVGELVAVEGSRRDRKLENQESREVSLDAVIQRSPCSNFDDLVGAESLERLEIVRILEGFDNEELKSLALEGFERRLE